MKFFWIILAIRIFQIQIQLKYKFLFNLIKFFRYKFESKLSITKVQINFKILKIHFIVLYLFILEDYPSKY